MLLRLFNACYALHMYVGFQNAHLYSIVVEITSPAALSVVQWAENCRFWVVSGPGTRPYSCLMATAAEMMSVVHYHIHKHCISHKFRKYFVVFSLRDLFSRSDRPKIVDFGRFWTLAKRLASFWRSFFVVGGPNVSAIASGVVLV